MIKYNATIVILAMSLTIWGQKWTKLDASATKDLNYEIPGEFYHFDYSKFRDSLFQHHKAILPVSLKNEVHYVLVKSYSIFENPESQYAKNIISFKGISNESTILGVLSQNSLSFMVRSEKETYFVNSIDPETIHISSISKIFDATNRQELDFSCGVKNHFKQISSIPETYASIRNNVSPDDLHKYRLAVATTGEFYKAKGNSKEKVMEEVVKIVGRVNSVLERDFGITLTLIENTDTLFYSDGSNDPYNNGQPADMLTENPSVVNNVIGSSNYDIGHVFGTNSGGVAWLEGLCGGQKAAGVSGTFGAYRGDLFYLIVAHEIGHQMGATHSFNRCDDENETGFTAFEPGSGSTIMSYAGASNCTVNYVENVMDPYYHTASINQVKQFAKIGGGNKCAEIISIDNLPPEVQIVSPKISHIPVNTPFELNGGATDLNEDNLTYVWEQYNLGPKSTLGSPRGDAPLFRSLPPTSTGYRSFPKAITVLNNSTDINEVLPTYDRNLNFRLTVRDNNNLGGLTNFESIGFKTISSAGPFLVEFANEKITIPGGVYRLINWAVANTNVEPVSCEKVHIVISLDGGINFLDTLARNTDNDGSEYVLIPPIDDSGVRLKIVAADNIFYDVSNANFSIENTTSSTFSASISDNVLDLCAPGSVSTTVNVIGINGFDEAVKIEIIDQLEDLEYSLDSAEVMSGGAVNINFTTKDILNSMQDRISIRLISSEDTVIRELDIIRTPSNFTSFEITSPLNGEGGIGSLPILQWKKINDAEKYFVQLSTSPSFDSLIESKTVLDTFLKPIFSLPENSIYFWRVQPINKCAVGPFTPIAAFQTQNINCNTYNSTDTPKTGTRKIESVITIEDDLPLSDINIPKMEGLIEFVGNIDAKLIHSDGTSVTLFKDQCSNRSNFDLGFDDEATLDISCPLTDQNIHIPEEKLSELKSSSSLGNWTLQINDNGGTSGGSITNWSLELCTNLTLNPPELESIDSLTVLFNGSGIIDRNFIKIADPDTDPSNLLFTLVNTSIYGNLFIDNTMLTSGDHFTYQDVLNGALTYDHFGDDLTSDQFSFIVSDENGGWIPITEFPINIDQTISSKKNELPDLFLFPNPTNGSISIKFPEEQTDLRIELYNMQGKILWNAHYSKFLNKTMDLPELGEGIYLLNLSTKNWTLTRKIWASN